MAQDRTLTPSGPLTPTVQAPWRVATALLAVFAAAILAHPGVGRLAPLIFALAVATVIWRALLAWRGIVAMLVLIILFVPFRRYELPSALPFNLEPYRLFVAIVALVWIASLLVDSRVRLRSTPIDPPLITLLIVCGLSIVVNGSRVQELGVGTDALKQLTFLTSFLIVFYFVASVVVDRADLDAALSLTVGAAALVAASSLLEYRTGFNAFSHLDKVVPFLKQTDALTASDVQRLGRLRVYGSAQHPIALGAAFVLLIPFSVYLARMRRIWLVATALLFLGAMGTLSRTAVVMLVSVVAVYLVLRPEWSIGLLRRFWIFILPAFVAFHLMLPGTIGTFKELFFPQGGLVAEQQAGSVGSSRGASFHAGREIIDAHPILGIGYGTRIPEGPGKNSFITDDQWVASGMEIGLLGLCVITWFFVRTARIFFRAAREDESPLGFLFTAVAAAAISFAVGMIFYDAFSFIQVTLLLFLVIALGCVGLRVRDQGMQGSPHP